MRPKSISMFEWLGLLSILLPAAQIARLAATGRMSSTDMTIGAVTTIVSIALVLFASRGRSRVALWVLSALTLIGIAAAGYSLGAAMGANGFGIATIVDLTAIALQAAAVAFAWTRASRAWFAGRDVATV